MSTEIKNTLFRFVSMRAPELISDFEENPKFILQADADKGIFNEAIDDLPAGNLKLNALATTANDFVDYIKNLEDLKRLNQQLYAFSIWLAKNKSTATEAEILAEKIKVVDADIDLVVVWENLFYQVITQKDFYIKEGLMQLLVASHVISDAQGDLKVKANAKVVLPEKLFIEDFTTESSASGERTASASPSFVDPILSAHEKQALSEDNINGLTQLKKELKDVESIYQQEYQVAYTTAYNQYLEDIQPIIDQYNEDVTTANNTWCTTRDPEMPIAGNDPCKQPPVVPQPKIPEFVFTQKGPLDKAFLSRHLSKTSYEIYLGLINTSPVDPEINDNLRLPNNLTTYSSLEASLTELIDHENETIASVAVDNGVSTLVIGGATISVPNSGTTLQPFEYELKTSLRGAIFNNTRFLQIMVGIPNAATRIESILYKMTISDGNGITKTSSAIKHMTGYDVALNLSMQGREEDVVRLNVTIQFANGSSGTIEISEFNLLNSYRGYVNFASDNIDPSTNPVSTSTIAPTNTFIPSGFGVKQIGIADYNKVEQSIHGYVEGEVAHIENIMAREFKEKSTRRLRRNETTETFSTETEREQLTDTSTADRFEMQSEVAKVIAQSSDFAGGVNSNTNWGGVSGNSPKFTLSVNSNYATHNSTEESTRQAVTNAKEITERALDRIVSKVKEERVVKILEEFEENNSHGFDNRKGDKHVVGVYRWVDKVLKNQIVNYGKRLMFEFMIPEPAKIHNLAMKELINQNKTNSISKPIDPRKALSNKVENYSQLTSTLAVHWSSVYNVDIDTMPSEVIHVTKSFSKDNVGINDNGYGRFTGVFNYNDFEIPEFYQAVSVKGNVNADKGAFIGGTNHRSKFYICGQEIIGSAVNITLQEKVKDLISISGIFWDILGVSGTLVAKCELTSEGKSNWQKETFNKIIQAYETALENYNQVLASEQAMGVQILGTNPGFYREIENVILRKNCISYLISSNPNDKLTFGKNFYTQNVSASSLTFGNAMLTQNADLDNYASFVKFMEQAFEWEIMSYNFYPFYWGNRDEWGQTYQFEQTHDNLFKSFMQSGMARVIVTVRPGFEEAVRYYMQTGQIWNGGEVPVIGDKMFLSVVDELKKPSGEKRGKAWPTRVPTSMTILQAQSIGLNVTKALPSLDNELSDFENPAEVPQSSQIDIELDAQIGGANPTGTARLVGSITGNQGIEAKIVLKKIDGSTQDITYCNTNGTWELNNIPAGRYELFLDANNDFPLDAFEVTTGSKQQVVELADDQVIEIDLTVAPV